MIRSFRCADTETLAQGWEVPRFQAFERADAEAARAAADGAPPAAGNG